MAPVTPWSPALWHCKAASVNAAAVLTGCAPTPDLLPMLLGSTAVCWAQPCYGAATVLGRRKAIQSNKFEQEITEGTFPPQLGIPTAHFPCCFLLYDFLFVFHMCWSSPEGAACHPRMPCASAVSDPATEVDPAAECRALLVVDGSVSCSPESLWTAFSCPSFPN